MFAEREEKLASQAGKPIENMILCLHRTTINNVSNNNANTVIRQGLSSVLQASIRHVIANNFKNTLFSDQSERA